MAFPADGRVTRQQRAILDATRRLATFASSQSVHRNLRHAGVEVGLSTVYRTLQRLAGRGEIDSVVSPSGEVWYRGCAADHGSQHHHLVCRRCGRAVEMESSEVESWIERVAAENNYIAVRTTVQLSGVCTDCAASEAMG